jgi:tRNA(Ile)-lysidine synthetase-like protein
LQNVTFAQIEAARLILAGDPNSPTSKHLPYNLQVTSRGQTSTISTRPTGYPNHALVSQDRPVVPRGWQASCDTGGEIALETNWKLEMALIMPPLPDARNLGDNNLTALFDLDALESLGPLVWRTRRAGDYMTPMGMMGRKSLQDCMVDAKIPREQRDLIPVLAQGEGGQILWIPGAGGRRSARAPVTEATRKALLVRWLLSADSSEQE